MAKKQAGDVFSVADEIRAGELPTAKKLAKIQKGYRCYSTGSFMLDLAIGEKDPVTGLPGIPERAIVEIFGANSSLKTATSEHLMKSVLDADPKNFVVAVYGEEPDADRLEDLGLDMDRIITLSFGNAEGDIKEQMAEHLLDEVKRLIRDPYVKLVVVDSLKSLCSVKQLFDKKGAIRDLDDSEQMAIRARLVGEFIRDFKQLNKSAILFMTNQTSEAIGDGAMYVVNPQFNIKTPAGRAKEFECTLRINAQTSPIWSEEKHKLTQKPVLLGWEVAYRLIKNKYSKTTGNRVAISQFYFNPAGFRRAAEVFNIAEYLGLVQALPGHRFSVGDKKFHGRDAAIAGLDKNPELRISLEAEIIKRSEEVFSLGEAAEGDAKASTEFS